MTQTTTFVGYVISAANKDHICVRVENEYLETIMEELSNAYDRTTYSDTLFVGIENAIIDIPHFTDITELVDRYIKLSVMVRRHSFHRIIREPNIDGNFRSSVLCRNVSIGAHKISYADQPDF